MRVWPRPTGARELDHKVKSLQIQAAQSEQTGQWIGMVENFNRALKEIWDVNWAQKIRAGHVQHHHPLKDIYKGQRQSAPSGSCPPPSPLSAPFPLLGWAQEADNMTKNTSLKSKKIK